MVETHTRARGQAAEDEGVAWLEEQGYRIVVRNVLYKIGEIDVVARDGDTLCFVEIKARWTRTYGPAIAAITKKKKRQLARTAALYLAHHPTDSPCRFDVLGMDLDENREWEFTLIKDAFMVPG